MQTRSGNQHLDAHVPGAPAKGGFGGSGATPSTLDTRSSAVQYFNNLEAGKRYRRWPTDVMMLLRPMMYHPVCALYRLLPLGSFRGVYLRLFRAALL